jgi:hypothetical protein
VLGFTPWSVGDFDTKLYACLNSKVDEGQWYYYIYRVKAFGLHWVRDSGPRVVLDPDGISNIPTNRLKMAVFCAPVSCMLHQYWIFLIFTRNLDSIHKTNARSRPYACIYRRVSLKTLDAELGVKVVRWIAFWTVSIHFTHCWLHKVQIAFIKFLESDCHRKSCYLSLAVIRLGSVTFIWIVPLELTP